MKYNIAINAPNEAFIVQGSGCIFFLCPQHLKINPGYIGALQIHNPLGTYVTKAHLFFHAGK